MDANQFFPRPFFRADDLQPGKALNLRIDRVTLQQFPDGAEKPVLSFEEIDRKLTLNRTNVTTLSAAFGHDTDGWGGKAVELYRDSTLFQGRTVPSLRIRPAVQTPTGQGKVQWPGPTGAPESAGDAIPF